jgi:hypothetical protein
LNPKIQIRKRHGFWWVSIPGEKIDFPYFERWIDAVSRVVSELKRKKGPQLVAK